MERVLKPVCATHSRRIVAAVGTFVVILGAQIGLIGFAYNRHQAGAGADSHGRLRSLADDVEERTCPNFGGGPPAKAMPSLSTCYFYTESTCCVAGHDADVGGAIGGLLPDSCAGGFDVLSEYMCMGCSPDIDQYITYYNADKTAATADANYATALTEAQLAAATTDKKAVNGKIGEIRLCESFARNLFYTEGKADTKINAYDSCAMSLGEDSPAHLSSLLFATTDDSSQELNFIQTVRPPTFAVADFEMSWYHETDCFGAASGLQLGSVAAILVALLAGMLA